MDIPLTGAVFTLGKSHLAENTQSYFYIRNDAIKKVIAGPYQSAVICDSGRLFVWGENSYGQLGICNNTTGQKINKNSTSNNNNSNNSNNSNNNINKVNDDIIKKPSCVKSLKSLGLKVTDMAFGNAWSIILTKSNELFYTGRNIFPNVITNVVKHFTTEGATEETTTATVTVNNNGYHDEAFKFVWKPFCLVEFDDCLSKSEEIENYTNVLAGNEHFMILTSFGRLLGWGSNDSHQLGIPKREAILKPYEIILDSPVQQFTCGPKSTLVLTEKGNLFLTGHLNDFIFPQFTELQKNLPSNEKIIYMNITQTNDIFIVTNVGYIYRSFESVRTKSLIFQRFYDYDSEEYGPIWKLLKGTSFYAVVTQNTQKFYTTFSESGHHLKTFREITKFRNLRILDMALGDQHILVHGIPRSGTAAYQGPKEGLLNNVTSAPYANNIQYDIENNQMESKLEETKETKNSEAIQLIEEESKTDKFKDYGKQSPTSSIRSQKSLTSIKSLKKPQLSEKQQQQQHLRIRTPYPDSTASSCSPPSVIQRTPAKNLTMYDGDDSTKLSSSALLESLPEPAIPQTEMPDVNVATPTPPTEIDEHLTLEIHECQDPLDNTKMINEIRFINNGIDVTANVDKHVKYSANSLDGKMVEITGNTGQEYNRKNQNKTENIKMQAEEVINDLENEIENRNTNLKQMEKNSKEITPSNNELISKSKQESDFLADLKIKENNERKLSTIKDRMESKIKGSEVSLHQSNMNEENVKENTSRVPPSSSNGKSMKSLRQQSNQECNRDTLSNSLHKFADETLSTVGNVTTKITSEMRDVKNSLQTLLTVKHNKVDVEQTSKEDNVNSTTHTERDLRNNSTQLVDTKTNNANNNKDDDERTTASVNSMNTPAKCDGAGGDGGGSDAATVGRNPFDDEPMKPFENVSSIPDGSNVLNTTFNESNKSKLRKQFSTISVPAETTELHHLDGLPEDTMAKEENLLRKFWHNIKEKSQSLSCGNNKSINIIDDQPPRYTEHDEYALQTNNEGNSANSKSCIIL